MSILMSLFSTMSTFDDHLNAKQQSIVLKKSSIKNLLFQEILYDLVFNQAFLLVSFDKKQKSFALFLAASESIDQKMLYV